MRERVSTTGRKLQGGFTPGPPRARRESRVRGLDWIRAVKWVVVALLAMWLLHLFISWLSRALT